MSASSTIHGIRTCSTMHKACAWLDERGVSYPFHDYKVAGIDRETLDTWVRKVDWETLLNKAGMTFRKLPENDKAGLDVAKAIMLMQASPSMIKRPVLEIDGALLVGFRPAEYEAAFGPG